MPQPRHVSSVARLAFSWFCCDLFALFLYESRLSASVLNRGRAPPCSQAKFVNFFDETNVHEYENRDLYILPMMRKKWIEGFGTLFYVL